MDNDNYGSSGAGFFSLLSLLFIGLKLGGVISWSWWYVTLPLWGPFVTVMAGSTVLLVLYLFSITIKSMLDRKTK